MDVTALRVPSGARHRISVGGRRSSGNHPLSSVHRHPAPVAAAYVGARVTVVPSISSPLVGMTRYASLMPTLAAFPAMMRRDRRQLGLRECRAAWLLGLTVRQYRALEDGDDTAITPDVWERMIEVFQWPQALARASRDRPPTPPQR